MKSSSFHSAGIVILCVGVIVGLSSVVIDIAAGISIILSSIVVFFVLQFFSSVLWYLELFANTFVYQDSNSYDDSVREVGNFYTRNSVLKAIKESGFKSTSKCKVDRYLFAVDSNRREWVVVTPDGTNSHVRSYDSFLGYEIEEYMGYMPQVHIRIMVSSGPEMDLYINSKNPDDDIAGIKSVLGGIKTGAKSV